MTITIKFKVLVDVDEFKRQCVGEDDLEVNVSFLPRTVFVGELIEDAPKLSGYWYCYYKEADEEFSANTPEELALKIYEFLKEDECVEYVEILSRGLE